MWSMPTTDHLRSGHAGSKLVRHLQWRRAVVARRSTTTSYTQLAALFDTAFADPSADKSGSRDQRARAGCERTNNGVVEKATLPMNNATKQALEQFLKGLKR
jgi:hypothetical protein